MKTLILTCGLPYSGKTTWALAQGEPIVSPDAIRLALHGERFLARAEPWVWTAAHTMVDALFEAGHDGVIVDATNNSSRRRLEWIQRHSGVRVLIAVMVVSVEECHRRAEAVGDDEILPVIDRMDGEWESPLEDGFTLAQEIHNSDWAVRFFVSSGEDATSG